MEPVNTIAFLPLIAVAVGAAFGLVAGRFLGMRWLLWLLGLLALASLVLVIWLAAIRPGNEEAGFVPFVLLTGGVFPALFGAILGGFSGRALAKRRARR